MRRLLCALLVLVPSASLAEVVQSTPAAIQIKTEVAIAAMPQRAYDAFVKEIAAWWNSEHTFSGDAKNLRLTASAGGCFCETLPRGGSVEHAVVINVVPNELVRLRGALGPLQDYGLVGVLSWKFTAAGSMTTATMTYNVSGSFPGGLDKVADAVDAVLTDQLQRLKRYVESR